MAVAYSILQPHIDAQAVRTALNLDVLDGELQQGLAGSGGPKQIVTKTEKYNKVWHPL